MNPTVYPSKEFTAKLTGSQHFLTKVMGREKLMLIGGDDDLAALSGK